VAKIAVALSGGVDSAVAAARLLDAGHDVTAVHLGLWADASDDARAVAAILGVPFLLWDFRDEFQRQVIDDFADEYARGLTPNPCLVCNRRLKFGAMLDRAVELGFDGMATGHYARLVGDDPAELHRGDVAKDQSYVLAVLPQPVLRRLWLPLGASSKQEVRQEAQARGLPVAGKAESMDVCFIEDGDTGAWLAARLGSRPGQIVSESGEVLGTHDGTYLYTIGQRRGLNLRRPAEDGQPRYVLGVDAPGGRVVVGPREHLAVDKLVAGPVVWSSGIAEEGQFEVQVRAHGEPSACVVRALADGCVEIGLANPIFGVAPGQTAVVYDGTRVVAAGVITASWSTGIGDQGVAHCLSTRVLPLNSKD